MKREKILKIVWPFLIGILVLVWGQALKTADPQRSSDQSRDTVVIAGSGGGAPVFVTSEMSGQSKKSSYPDWGRNPFVVSSAVSQEFILGGVLWDVNKPAAIINGEIVVRGGWVGPYIVVDVRQDRVILNDGEKDLELRLEKEE